MKQEYLDYGRVIPGAKKFNRNRSNVQPGEDEAELYYSTTKANLWPVIQKTGDPYTDFLKTSVRNSLRTAPIKSDNNSILKYKAKMLVIKNAVDEATCPEQVISVVAFIESLPEADQNEIVYRHLNPRLLSEDHMQWLQWRKANRKNRPKKLKPILKEMHREGKNWRDDKDIITEDFAKTFNFDGIQYGIWVSDKERINYINTSYEALKDMCDILNLDEDFLGLGGKLAIAFGARGNGKANGHYEPDLKVINLTRFKGQGIIGHEWFHALDHWLGNQFGNGNLLSISFTQGISDLPSFNNLVKTIYFESLNYRKESILIDSIEHRQKEYWAAPEEMMARAFQAYLQDKMKESGITNDFLTTETIYQDESGQYHVPYPQGTEREEINKQFDILFNDIRNRLKKPLKMNKVAFR